jgi:uncharacterized protein (TIGR03492 family)
VTGRAHSDETDAGGPGAGRSPSQWHRRVLLVSNGHGEAAIAGYVAQALTAGGADFAVEHMALVGGSGEAAGLVLVGPSREMPSGGLVANWNLRALTRDLRAGLGSLTFQQRRFLREWRQRCRGTVVAIGDIFCLWMALCAAPRPVFVATAKSDAVARHSSLECMLARRAAVVFARDPVTARSLAAAGVNARYEGNAMMDGTQPQGYDLGVNADAVRFGVLPGSRRPAIPAALAALERLKAIEELFRSRGRPVQAFVSVAPGVDVFEMVRAMREAAVDLAFPQPRAGEGAVARGRCGGLEIVVVRGAFGDLLAAAQVVLGQAGTANEQAAGAGRPVVAALEPNESPTKMSWYRMRQKRLLGEALLVLPGEPRAFAQGVVALVDDPARCARMAEEGRARMGGPGASVVIAKAIAAQALATGGPAAGTLRAGSDLP